MPYKLLLADDSVTIQRVIELTFAEEDVRVTAVSDGQQAIDLIQADPPHIVLADVAMPLRDGYEVAAVVKNNPALQHIPVLLLTGAFEPIDEARAQSVRCDGVLAKPFEPQLLINRVKELLRGIAPSPAGYASADRGGDAEVPAPDAVEALPAETESVSAVQALMAAPANDEPAVDDDATIRLTRPPVFPGEDLRLDVESLEIRAEPEPVPDATLDEYFDRLDEAFAHLASGQPGREPGAPATPSPAEPWGSAGTAAEWPPPAGATGPDRGDAFGDFDSERARPEVLGPGPEVGASSSPVDDLEAAASAVAVDVPDAFAALLDAEREHGPDVVHLGASPLAAGIVLPGTAVTEAFVDDLVRRVSARLGDSAVRGQVAEIVSAIAERLVREEIDRLKAGLGS